MAVISVIVPVHNAAPYLRECIESVARQSFGDWELVLVDDASTDDSLLICREYAGKDPRVRSLEIAHGGVSAARNAGLRAATGEWIAFLDADDTYAPDAFELLLAHSEGVEIVAGEMIQSVHNPIANGSHRKGKGRVVRATEAVIRTLYQERGLEPGACAKLYRKAVFDFPEPFVEGRRYEDLESFARFYLKATNICLLPVQLYRYRTNPDSFINTLTAARTDALWAGEELLATCRRECREALDAARSRRFSAYYNIYALAENAGDNALAQRCMALIKKERRHILADRHVRFKNKAGALLSYLPRSLRRMACRFMY